MEIFIIFWNFFGIGKHAILFVSFPRPQMVSIHHFWKPQAFHKKEYVSVCINKWMIGVRLIQYVCIFGLSPRFWFINIGDSVVTNYKLAINMFICQWEFTWGHSFECAVSRSSRSFKPLKLSTVDEKVCQAIIWPACLAQLSRSFI